MNISDSKLIWDVYFNNGMQVTRIICDGMGYKKPSFYKILKQSGRVEEK